MTRNVKFTDNLENTEVITSTETNIETGTQLVETIEYETFDPDQSNVDNMVDTLSYMGQGMLGILIVTVIIIACVAILNKTTSRKKKDD